MAKLIQLKDKDGLVYPNILKTSVIKSLLNNPLQASSTIATLVSTTLNDNWSKYDVIAFNVAQGQNGSENVWVIMFPKFATGGLLDTTWYIDMYHTNYTGGGSIRLSGTNTISLWVRYQNGWNNNSMWLNKVIGIII